MSSQEDLSGNYVKKKPLNLAKKKTKPIIKKTKHHTNNEELLRETQNSNPDTKIKDLNYDCQTQHL